MNRRTFIAGSVAIATFLPAFASVQESTPEARWDETSQLFGNAWDLLPSAREGEIELLNLTLGKDSMMGSTILGVIHNATTEPRILMNVKTGDPAQYLYPSVTQSIIQPGGYALFEIDLMTTLDPDSELPPLDLEFISPDEVEDSVGFYSESTPITIDAVAFDGEQVMATLTNASDLDIPESSLSGMIMFFDETGMPTLTVSSMQLDPLAAGASMETQNYIFDEYDPTAPFLMGYYGDTE